MVDSRRGAAPAATRPRPGTEQAAALEPGLPTGYTNPPRHLVGRREPLQAIASAIERLRRMHPGADDAGQIMVVRGDVGSGRTATVANGCRNLAHRGIRLRVGVTNREGVSYGPIMHALPELRPSVSRVVGSGDPSTERSLVARRLTTTLRRLSDDKPLVLVIEDIDAADSQTLFALQSITSVTLPGKVLLILTCPDATTADDRGWRSLVDNVGGNGGQMVDLAPLRVSDIRRMVAICHDDEPPDRQATLARRIQQLSHGNAYIASMLCCGAPLALHSVPPPRGVEPTVTIGVHLRHRIDDPLLEDLLTAAALIGHRFDVRLLASVLDATEGDTVRRLARARELDLCHPVDGTLWQFDHRFTVDYFTDRMPLLRPLIYARIARHELAPPESMPRYLAGASRLSG